MKILHFKHRIVEAHRGASGYEHQNTIPAFDKALEMGSDAIELDLRKTEDGKIIVVHDPEFHQIPIGKWNYTELLSETRKENFEMPLFTDVLQRYKGKILLDVEIKEEGYEAEIIAMIKRELGDRDFHIRSFSEKTLITVKNMDPTIFTVLLLGVEFPKYGFFTRLGELFPYPKVKRSRCDAVSPNHQLVRAGFVRRMHRLKKPVLVWTVDDEEIMKRILLKEKADGIVTDYPDKALKILGRCRSRD